MDKLSELIEALEAIKAMHGDLMVRIDDSYGFTARVSIIDIDGDTVTLSALEGDG